MLVAAFGVMTRCSGRAGERLEQRRGRKSFVAPVLRYPVAGSPVSEPDSAVRVPPRVVVNSKFNSRATMHPVLMPESRMVRRDSGKCA